MAQMHFRNGIVTTLVVFTLILVCIILWDNSAYTQDEIDWCNEHMPLVPINICSKEFGY